MKTYWAIEDRNGKLANYDDTTPVLARTKKEAQRHADAWQDYRPVKVEIRKVEEKNDI
mgnify:FL=1